MTYIVHIHAYGLGAGIAAAVRLARSADCDARAARDILIAEKWGEIECVYVCARCQGRDSVTSYRCNAVSQSQILSYVLQKAHIHTGSHIRALPLSLPFVVCPSPPHRDDHHMRARTFATPPSLLSSLSLVHTRSHTNDGSG